MAGGANAVLTPSRPWRAQAAGPDGGRCRPRRLRDPDRGRARGAFVSVDSPARRPSSTRRPRAASSRPTLALASILTPNRGELLTLAGGDATAVGDTPVAGARPAPGTTDRIIGPGTPAAQAKALRGSIGGGAVLVSLGAAGALLVAGRKSTTIRAPLLAAVDTVGAGDTLNGVLAAGLASGLDLGDSGAAGRGRGRVSRSRGPALGRGCRPGAELERALAGSLLRRGSV